MPIYFLGKYIFKIFKSCQLHTQFLKFNMLHGSDDNMQYKIFGSVSFPM